MTGQIAVAKAVDTAAAQSFAGKLIQRLHSSSVFECLAKLQLSVSIPLDLSLVLCYDADWRPLVCFGPTNQRAKDIRSERLGLFAHHQRCRGHALAFVESLARLAITSTLLMFLRILSLLHILFPVTSETASRSSSRR